jgi:uncharacterized protein
VVAGTGTLINVVAILAGSAVGVALGDRLPQRTREVVTDGLGLVVLLIAALSAAAVLEPAFRDAVGPGGPVLIVLGAVLVGGIVGSLLRLEDRMEAFGGWLRRRLVRDADVEQGHRFVEGFVSASLVFCVGPLAVLGSLSDGLGNGIEQLALKAALDGVASIAFAAALGWGVAASAAAVLVYQGFWTLLGVVLGDLLPEAAVAALTATGGLLLVGVALRLLRLRDVPVADLLPALLIAPILTAIVIAIR